MPFQSEKQRRYLWANEPEIARDWTDTYGSRIESNAGGMSRLGFDVGSPEYNVEQYKKEKSMIDQWRYDQQMQRDFIEDQRRKKVKEQKHMAANGGVMSMQGGVKNYLGEQKEVTAPVNWQSSPDHPTTELAYITEAEKDLLVNQDLHNSLNGGVNRGPSGVMSLNGWGSAEAEQNRAGSDITAAMDADPGGAGAAGWADTSTAHLQGPTGKSPAELSLLASKKGSTTVMPDTGPLNQGFFGNLKDKIFQGRGDYEDQAAWQKAKDERIGQKRIDRILNRSDEFPITEDTYKNLMDAGWEGAMPALDSTATSRGDENTYEGIRNINVPQAKTMVDVAETGLQKQADAIPISGQNDYWNALNMKPINIGYIPEEFKPSITSFSTAKGLHKKATTEGIGAIQFENWMKNEGAELKKLHPDYANTLLKELKISDAEKLYPRDNLDVKGRNTEKKQREALNTLMGKIETAKNQPDTNSINIRSDLVEDYIKNVDKYNDLGITDIDQFKEFINIYVPKDTYT